MGRGKTWVMDTTFPPFLGIKVTNALLDSFGTYLISRLPFSLFAEDLWNVSYDRLLRADMPVEIRLAGYADDEIVLLKLGNYKIFHFKICVEGKLSTGRPESARAASGIPSSI